MASSRGIKVKKIIVSIFMSSGLLPLMLIDMSITENQSLAQIKPDSTLRIENTTVTPKVVNNVITDQIEGGAVRGANLFHSFEQFSVLSGHVAYFNNAIGIQNIISRVTGSSISNIDGLLKANGVANLFLINPNGIIFGPNARLNIGGSFLANTASSINFSDGKKFSANAPEATPLLSINVPIGLQFGANPGKIQLQGTGNSLNYSLFSPIIGAGSSPTGLRVQQGKTLALVGGDVELRGETLTAGGGRIELGAVSFGVVSLNPSVSGWLLGYQDVQNFKDIHLSQQASVDVSGFDGGFVQVQGAHVNLSDGSSILTQNQGVQPGGSIKVNASESLELVGTAPQVRIPSGLFSENVGIGNGGNIVVSAKHLLLQDGGAINTRNFTSAPAGDITVNAFESVQIIGFSPINLTAVSGIGSYTFNSAKAGNIRISTGELTALNGGTVISSTFGIGGGGDVIIDASQYINIAGIDPFSQQPSILSTSTLNAGNSGSLKINTSELSLKDGGVISSSTLATGDAGSTTINASSSIDISNFSNIVSAATGAPSALQRALKLPFLASGAAGDLTIKTGRLHLTNKGLLGVNNQGIGDAGTLRITDNYISLDNESAITASTTFGKGGNLQLTTKDLQLRHKSLISATAGNPDNQNKLREAFIAFTGNESLVGLIPVGTGRGGDLNINAGTVVASENSNISANAYGGKGGQVEITTQGIFRSPDSPITASSQLGINGTVQINTLEQNPVPDAGILPVAPVDFTKLIVQGCPGNTGPRRPRLTVIGSGGPPPSPSDPQEADTVWANAGNAASPKVISDQSSDQSNIAPIPSTVIEYHGGPIIEAQGMVRGKNGDVIFTAAAPTLTPDIPWLRSPSCQTH